jgi:hypothetical protein
MKPWMYSKQTKRRGFHSCGTLSGTGRYVGYPRFGTACWSRLQESNDPRPTACPETSLTTYKPTPRNIAGERRPQITPRRKPEMSQTKGFSWSIHNAAAPFLREPSSDYAARPAAELACIRPHNTARSSTKSRRHELV